MLSKLENFGKVKKTMKLLVVLVVCVSGSLVGALTSEEISDVTENCCYYAEGLGVSSSSLAECSALSPPQEIEPEQVDTCKAAITSCCQQLFEKKDDCSAGAKFAVSKRCSASTTDIGKTCCEECSLGRWYGESQGEEACEAPSVEGIGPTQAIEKTIYYQCCLEAAKTPTTTAKPVATTTKKPKPKATCSPSSCEHNCDDDGGVVRCSCREGYRLQADKKSCIDINECAEAIDDLCTSENTVCHNVPGTFKCVSIKKRDLGLSCPPGFKRNVINQVCDDINECQLPRPPCPKYLCENSIGGYKCGGKPGKPFEEAVPGAPKPVTESPVTSPAPKIDNICPPGFRAGADDECLDIDECTENIDDCQRLSQNCINTHGSFFCQDHVSKRCSPGFKVNAATGICEDIDECEESSEVCKRNEVCINLPGAYNCKSKISQLPKLSTSKCQEGTRRRPGGKICEDIDECREGTHLCDQFQNCINTFGAHECRCKNGFELDSSSGSCVDIDECTLKLDNCGPGLHCLNELGSFACTRRTPSSSTTSTTTPIYEYEYYYSNEDNATDERDPLPDEPPITVSSTTVRPIPPPRPTLPPRPSYTWTTSPPRSTPPTTTSSTTPIPTTTSSTTKRPRPVYPTRRHYTTSTRKPETPKPEPPKPEPSSSKPAEPEDVQPVSNLPSEAKPSIDPYGTRSEERPTSPDNSPKPSYPSRPDYPSRPNYPSRPESTRPDLYPNTPENRTSYPTRPSYPSRPEPSRSDLYPYKPENRTSYPTRPEYPRRPYYSARRPSTNKPDPPTTESTTDASTTKKSNAIDDLFDPNEVHCLYGYEKDAEGRCVEKGLTVNKPLDPKEVKCLNGYESDVNGNCVDIDECKTGHHVCDSLEKCVNIAGGYTCECVAGFTRGDDGWCVATTTTTTSTTEKPTTERSTTAVSETPSWGYSPYQPPSSPRGSRVYPSRPSSPSVPTVCELGYKWDPSYQKCVDIDECSINHDTCAAEEDCVNMEGGFKCICGSRCRAENEKPAYVPVQPSRQPLDPGSNVITVGAQYGQRGPWSPRPSYSRDPHSGSIMTSCPWGYKLTPDKRCYDIDECAKNTSECGPQQRCENFYGGYSCQCPSGHKLLGQNDCGDIDECMHGNPCSYNAECVNTVGSYRCQCTDGFRNAPTNDKVCEDVDECAETPSVCHQGCANAWGSYRCYCKRGYRLGSDNRTCVDVNECEEWSSVRLRGKLCGGECINEPGSYRCSCPHGYRLSEDQRSCVDIDECETGEASCARSSDPGSVCQNTRGSYHCHRIDCPPGYRLESKHRCTRITQSCRVSDVSCLQQPSSYSYNFITFVANIYLPAGSVDLFTMHGPAWIDSVVSFELRMVSVEASPGVTPADLRCFDMRPSGNVCAISLLCSLGGPQVAELELTMSLYQRGTFAGSAVARIIIIVSKYEF